MFVMLLFYFCVIDLVLEQIWVELALILSFQICKQNLSLLRILESIEKKTRECKKCILREMQYLAL